METKKAKCLNDDDFTALLYCEIFGTEEDGDDYNTSRILDALNTLSERERYVIERWYRYDWTLAQISNEIGVGKERVRQILLKAIRKLRHPSRMRDMSVSQIERERDKFKQIAAEQEAVIQELRRHIDHISNGVCISDELRFPVDALEKDISEICLPVRPYNCLWHAGFKTVRDIYEIASNREFRSIRNLGRKSQEQVICAMREMGFADWANKMSVYSDYHAVKEDNTE